MLDCYSEDLGWGIYSFMDVISCETVAGHPSLLGFYFGHTHASMEIWSEMLIFMVYAWFKVYFHSLFSGTILICDYYFVFVFWNQSISSLCVCFDYLK